MHDLGRIINHAIAGGVRGIVTVLLAFGGGTTRCDTGEPPVAADWKWPIPVFPEWRLLGSSVERPQSGSSIGEAVGRHRPGAEIAVVIWSTPKLPFATASARRSDMLVKATTCWRRGTPVLQNLQPVSHDVDQRDRVAVGLLGPQPGSIEQEARDGTALRLGFTSRRASAWSGTAPRTYRRWSHLRRSDSAIWPVAGGHPDVRPPAVTGRVGALAGCAAELSRQVSNLTAARQTPRICAAWTIRST